MLMAHPAVLRNLVEHYEALAALAHSDIVGPHIHRQMQDTAYTLCVSTGTRDIDAALDAARQQIDAGLDVGPDVGPNRTALDGAGLRRVVADEPDSAVA